MLNLITDIQSLVKSVRELFDSKEETKVVELEAMQAVAEGEAELERVRQHTIRRMQALVAQREEAEREHLKRMAELELEDQLAAAEWAAREAALNELLNSKRV